MGLLQSHPELQKQDQLFQAVDVDNYPQSVHIIGFVLVAGLKIYGDPKSLETNRVLS